MELPPRKRRRVSVVPATQSSSSRPTSTATSFPTTATSATFTNGTSTTGAAAVNVLSSSVKDIQTYAQSIATRTTARLRTQCGYTSPLPLATVLTNDLHMDESTCFLYYASVARALHHQKLHHQKTQQQRSLQQQLPIRIFAIMKHSGQLFNLIVQAARAAQCPIDLQAICLSSTKISNDVNQTKKRTDERNKHDKGKHKQHVQVTSQVHAVAHLLEDHGRAVSSSQLSLELQHVLQTGRLLVCDALGAFGGNCMIGELMNASSLLFLQPKVGEQEAQEAQEGQEGRTEQEGQAGDGSCWPRAWNPVNTRN